MILRMVPLGRRPEVLPVEEAGRRAERSLIVRAA